MIKKLTKFGNSMALILDKPLLELLEISQKTNLKIKTDGYSFIITPIKDENEEPEINIVSKNEKLQKLHEKNIKKYTPALKKLAE